MSSYLSIKEDSFILHYITKLSFIISMMKISEREERSKNEYDYSD